jgi:predicted nucleotidyltransferase
MRAIGIVAEYNPFHSGHRYHIEEIRHAFGEQVAIVCVMSGNWVQRGDAAILDKWTRARAALLGGADLILELPTVWAASSAEPFAEGAVSLLTATGIVSTLSFGSESGDLSPLQATADFLSTEAYTQALRRYLDLGQSYPLARQQAANDCLGSADAACLNTPNNTLGIEYLRAITRLNSPLTPSTILRQGASHDSTEKTATFASASYLRQEMLGDRISPLAPYLTQGDLDLWRPDRFASLSYGTRGVLARLRAMTRDDFLALPDCTEGLHNRLYKACHECNTLEELYAMVKTRRYTHSRIRRLVLWAYLGLTAADRPKSPPYLRVLGMTAQGQGLLKELKKRATVPILTKAAHARRLPEEGRRLFELEEQCTALYELCRHTLTDRAQLSEYSQNPVIVHSGS